ncbi:unnamed protein product [Haemonchus placei]|uniref:Uncharacterized protein n=1 Tax=Haemonchus placei TaxID=6290 RepID=A0A0N4WDM4_HAEPC|nr:unnamed protein product [Haemonchus placei]
MDDVDVAIHLEPLVDALTDIKDQLNMFTAPFNVRIDAIADLLNRQSEMVYNKLDALHERPRLRSSCVFCTFEDNKDHRPTGWCYRFVDPVSRAVQASNLRPLTGASKPVTKTAGFRAPSATEVTMSFSAQPKPPIHQHPISGVNSKSLPRPLFALTISACFLVFIPSHLFFPPSS